MDNLGISAYGTLNRTLGSTTAATASSSNSESASTSGSSLDMNDFLKLLAAQFENQDIMNPTDNTEFISEMAQFSSLQAMNELTEYEDCQYAASLVGKTVVVGQYDKTGTYKESKGVVQSASFSSSGSSVVVGGTAYSLGAVVQVVQPDTSGSSSNQSDGKTS